MKIGSERPIRSSTTRGIRHMNQPLKSTSTRLCNHLRGADVAGGEVPVGVAVERRLPPEPPRLHDLAERVQARAGEQGEHVTADDGRATGQVAEGDGADDALGLADDVVVHHHRVGRRALAERLELAAGVAAGAAEVALLVDDEQVAECLLGEREELVVGDLLLALLGDEDGVEVGPQQLVLADLGEQLGAEVRLVERGDDDVDRAVLRAVGGHLGGPLGRLDDGVLVAGHDVVPVPAAVGERRQRQVELERAVRSPSTVAASTRCERPLAIDL